MNPREITTQISKAADFLNLKKWDYGASFSNDYSVQVDKGEAKQLKACLLYTSPSPRDLQGSRMPSSA